MKKIIIVICTIFFIAIFGIALHHFKNNSYITIDEAKEIAINDVSNKDNNYIFNSVEFKETNKMYVYNLIFTDKINIYTYRINAKNRKIIYSKKESLNNTQKYMKEEDIINLVLEHAKLNKNKCNIISNLIKIEDGIPYYYTIFYYNSIRYEYKTNAFTGAIISVIKLNENAM